MLTDEQEKRLTAFEQGLDNITNVFSPGDMPLEAAKKMARNHRSLQQRTMGLFLLFVKEMSENGTDARNEEAVKAAKTIMKAFGGELPPMPFI